MMAQFLLSVIASFCLALSNGNPLNSSEERPPLPELVVDYAPPPPNELEIWEINQEIENEELSRLRTTASCPDLSECYDDCLLGRQPHPVTGCPMCGSCKKEGHIESDIIVDESNYENAMTVYGVNKCGKSTRGASSDPRLEWPKNGDHVTIPFRFVGVSSTKRANILRAIEQYRQKTCIRFAEVSDGFSGDHIRFVGDESKGCSSYVGRVGRGGQDVTIGRNCDRQQGTIIHEIMHALGFWHEQSRGDRDNHVEILFDNVQPNAVRNFKKRDSNEWESHGSPYDTGSVMHYGGFFFSNSRVYGEKPTIVHKQTREPVEAQREGFSEQDLIQINRKYKCSRSAIGSSGSVAATTTTTPSPATCVDKNENCASWASDEHCRRDDIREYCPVSCNVCPGATTTGTTSVTSQCFEEPQLTSDCVKWKANNFCTTNTYVRTNCKRTCGFCGEASTTQPTTQPTTVVPVSTGGECRDKQNSCEHWVSLNYCTENHVSFMRTECPKACGFCGTTTSAPQCTDSLSGCEAWANSGLCVKGQHVEYMKKNCRKSCTAQGVGGLCGSVVTPTIVPATTPRPSSTTCVNNDKNCQYWADMGHCTNTENNFQSFMRRECRRACGLCGGGATTPTTAPTPTRTFPTVEFSGDCGIPATTESFRMLQRIVGGKSAVYGSIPWMAMLKEGQRDFCGGTLINNRFIVTAAHCFYTGNRNTGNVNTMYAYLGKHHRRRQDGGELRVNFRRIIEHPRYRHHTSENDIALIELRSPVTFNNYIRPVCLPQAGAQLLRGTDALVAGWGDQKRSSGATSDELQEVTVKVVERDECNDWLGPYNGYRNEVTENMFCAGYREGGKDACQGDSGGPLIVKQGRKQYLFGVVSWGYGCASRDRPGVYTKVANMMNWISGIIRQP